MPEKIIYVDRPTFIIDAENFDPSMELLHPEFVIGSFRKKKDERNGRAFHDLGRFCYRDRGTGENSRDPMRNYVNLESLDIGRRECIRNIFLIHIRTKSVLHRLASVKYFFDFIDGAYGRPVDFRDQSSVKQAYMSYTTSLINETGLSRINKQEDSISSGYGYSNQQAALLVVCACFPKLPRAQIKLWAPTINQRKHKKLPSAAQSEDEMAKMFAIHLTIFKTLAEFVVNRDDLPVRVQYARSLNYPKVVWHTSQINSKKNYGDRGKSRDEWIKFAYQEDGELYSGNWAGLASIAKAKGVELPVGSNRFNSVTIALAKRQHELRGHNSDKEPTSSLRRTIANMAIYHFCHSLLADTGADCEQLSSIDFTSETTISAIDRTRLITIKNRGDLKEQPLEFTNRFERYWRLYIKLREWCMPDHRNFDGIFNFDKAGTISLLATRELVSKAKTIFVSKDMPYVIPRDWRKNTSYMYLDESNGDLAFVSKEILHNTVETAKNHYAFRNVEESIREIYPFLNKMRSAASYRRDNLIPTLRVVEDSAHEIITGRCTGDAPSDSQLADEFNENAPTPGCKTPIYCLFCKQYGVHADIKDIIRLLSLKKWISYQSKNISKDIDEHYGKFYPVFLRADEILDLLNEEASSVYSAALQEFESGYIDPYWSKKIDEIIDSELFA